MLRRFDHLTIVVRDIDRAKAFFALLGFKEAISVIIAGEPFASYMGVPGIEAEHVTLVLEKASPRTEIQLLRYRHPDPLPDPHIRDLNKLGMNHVCFAVDDIEAEVAKLRASGFRRATRSWIFTPASWSSSKAPKASRSNSRSGAEPELDWRRPCRAPTPGEQRLIIGGGSRRRLAKKAAGSLSGGSIYARRIVRSPTCNVALLGRRQLPFRSRLVDRDRQIFGQEVARLINVDAGAFGQFFDLFDADRLTDLDVAHRLVFARRDANSRPGACSRHSGDSSLRRRGRPPSPHIA